MRILGHGVDLERIARIKAEIDSPDSRWLESVYSADERMQAEPEPEHYRYYAGRFSGKEAVAKALGTGFAGDITWRGIEILRAASGSPYVRLSDKVLLYASNHGIREWMISLSYTDEFVMASAIAVGD